MAESIVYRDKFLIVRKKPQQGKRDYTIVKFRPSVAIVAVTPNDKIVLIKQYREPLEKEILELPAGVKDRGDETALQTAKRELIEETGYTSKTWTSLGRFSIEPNVVATQPFIFLALDATRKQQMKIEENIKHREYTWNEIEELINKRQLTDALSIASLYAAKIYLNI
ncbi:MAG: NUDIX hydrolase [Candidatus Micrarchaeota archaeon]